MKNLLILLAFGIISACNQNPSSGLSKQDEEAIRATSAKWLEAARSGNWEELVETYTEDAVLSTKKEDIIGRPAILEHFKSQSPKSNLDLQINEIEGRGDLAFVSGTASVIPDGGMPIIVAKYLDIRKRQSDGSWLFYRDMVIGLSAEN